MSEKAQAIIEKIEELNVLELNNLVKTLEARWGVSAAAAPAMVVAAPAGGAPAAAEEKTEFKVLLKEVGAKKIEVIKVVRQVTDLGLKEAKEVVDKAPSVVKESVTKEAAADIKKKFEEVGAVVVIE